MAKLGTAACVHRWVLTQSLARVSAVCRRCGGRRTYPAAQEYYTPLPVEDELDRSSLVTASEGPSFGGQAVA